MKCDCCGRRKKLFESFERISNNLNVCVDCSTLLYKYKDSKNEETQDNSDEIKKLIEDRKKQKASKEFNKWFESFTE